MRRFNQKWPKMQENACSAFPLPLECTQGTTRPARYRRAQGTGRSTRLGVASLASARHSKATGDDVQNVSKKLRFSIFKRDSFTCQYCGNRPPEVILELDHIHPRSQGGDNCEINLITACYACNRGKGKTLLGDKAIRPDADLKFLEAQQEIAEAKRFLAAKAELDEVRQELVCTIQTHWDAALGTDGTVPADKVILAWLNRYSADAIIRAIDCSAPMIIRTSNRFRHFGDYLAYIGAVLRNQNAESQERVS